MGYRGDGYISCWANAGGADKRVLLPAVLELQGEARAQGDCIFFQTACRVMALHGLVGANLSAAVSDDDVLLRAERCISAVAWQAF